MVTQWKSASIRGVSLDKNLASHPDISPDGETLVFVLGHHLWTVNLDGSNLRQLTAMSDSFERYPTWSADGKYIVYLRPGRCLKVPVSS